MKCILNKRIVLISSAIVLLFLTSCSGLSESGKYTFSEDTGSLYNPFLVEAELKINIRNIKVFADKELREDNIKNNIPPDTNPVLKIWCADINKNTTQKKLSGKTYLPIPYRFVTDNENGNTILYYNLSDKLFREDSIIISRKFNFVSYEYKYDNQREYNASLKLPDELIAFYTKSEKFLEQRDDIAATADSITSGLIKPREKAEAIFRFIRDKMIYKYPPEKRGVIPVFECFQGDCGQYSYLFVTLARSAGIPSRCQNGFYFSPDKIGYHVWTEIFLEGYGWIPVDPTDKDGFLKLNGHRLIASVGNNIKLPGVPEWASYQNSEVENGMTDFMQLATMVTSGFTADISTERIIHSFSPLN